MCLALLTAGCRVWTDTSPTDSAPPTDSDADTTATDTAQPGPCGPDTPPTCVEKIDGTCFMPGVYESWPPMTDDRIAELVQRSFNCGFRAIMHCRDGKYVSNMLVTDAVGRFPDGTLDLLEGSDGLEVYDGVTRELVAVGRFPTEDSSTGCEFSWWGDAEAYACVQPMFDLVQARYYPSCTDDVDAVGECDYCNCRYNDVTEVQNPACETDDP